MPTRRSIWHGSISGLPTPQCNHPASSNRPAGLRSGGAIPTYLMKLFSILLVATLATVAVPVSAEVVKYDLTIDETAFAPHEGKRPRRALAVNGGIPGPTLRFREGDTARITVHNRLDSEETSVHWHGLLVPNSMDGVPYLTTPPIPPGGDHLFEFELRHPGTYWYHSHTGLQEQRGVYGSIVVEPRGEDPVLSDRDYVVVLSDWTNENPHEVMRTLMRGSEWYAIEKGNAQSLLGAWKAGALGDYLAREKGRMPPMDISDVAYDAFLINGQTASHLNAEPGERIRLRVINAGASSYFYLHTADGPLTIVSADGTDVRPVEVPRVLIGMAETYDILFTVPLDGGRREFRATAQDNSGHASLWIGGDGERQPATALPDPQLYTMDEMLLGALEDMGEMEPMGDMAMQGAETPRIPAPYKYLRSLRPTSVEPEPGAGVRELDLRLTGDMQRYRWSINGKTLSEESTIPVRRGEVLRLKLINDTMMHHPMHLHGHFFRLLNGGGDHAPLKHTVDVPPMGTRTIEFLADEEGDWFFHCHLLYHMDAGMARVFSYEAAENPDHQPAYDPKLADPWFFFLDGMALHSMTMGRAMAMTGKEDFYAAWDYGFHEHEEYEIDLGWEHYFGPNLTAGIGYRITNEDGAEDRPFAGVSYRLPYMVRSRIEANSSGLRASLGKEITLTPRLSIGGDVQYDTDSEWEWEAGASYTLTKRLSLVGLYHSNHGAGFGFGFSF